MSRARGRGGGGGRGGRGGGGGVHTMTRSGYSETMTLLESPPVRSAEEEVPPLSALLSSLDVASRSEEAQLQLRNTIQAMILRAQLDGVDPVEYLKLAVLIGFKRRNHDKSQAPGVGAGEKSCLRTILQEIFRYDPGMVRRVLPLVPVYGSWRDLLVLAEMAYGLENELSQEISRIFASQLQKDEAVVKNSTKDCPSNACKYAPHEFRHTGSRKTRKAGKKSENRKIQAHLGDRVASTIFPSVSHPRPMYRKLLSSLNDRLAKKGFLVEPLICRNEMNRIQFNRAPKGSLNKYRKALMKNPEVARKWRDAMSKSDSAVVDISELLDVASQILADEDEDILSLMIAKCVSKLKDSRQELTTQATKLLGQIQKASEDDGENFSQLFQELQIGSGVVVYPVIDSSGASQVRVVALLLSAYLIARAQRLSHFVYDGSILQIYQELTTDEPSDAMELEKEASSTQRSPESQEEIKFALNFLRRAKILSSNQAGLRSRPDIERISVNVSNLLDSVPFDASKEGAIRYVDVMFLTTSTLSEVQEALEEYRSILATLQNRPDNLTTLRTLCIHRLNQTNETFEGTIPLVMRPSAPLIDRSRVTLDLLLVMDLTGSMGAWMDQAKQHLTNIVNSLRDETGIGEIRVGFVGYRDYGDDGRTVQHAFVPISNSEAVLTVLRAQQPSGGGDLPEDVLAGFALAFNEFHWNADLRLVLFVADAPAHGYMVGGGRGDNYRSGRCPDQEPPHLNLEETCRSLADISRVDLLFCRLNSSTATMEEMFSSVYHSGGFGVIPINSGPEAFRSAILSTISTSILKALAPENVSGLQTFSGATASSLFATVNSSLRESLNSISKSFRPVEEVPPKETGMDLVSEPVDEVGENGIELHLDGEEEDSETKLDAPEDDRPSERIKESRLLATAGTARTDYERIMSELNLEELNPVRLALGLPIEMSLLDKAVEVLLSAGVTVQDLINQNYPTEIIDAMASSGLKKLEKI